MTEVGMMEPDSRKLFQEWYSFRELAFFFQSKGHGVIKMKLLAAYMWGAQVKN
jgi:hypothetical protein